MSIFSTALSGIQAASEQLSVFGNNISNAATVGFKESAVAFSDVYNSGGVKVAGVIQSFNIGNVTATNNTLDLAINGSGFYILNKDGAALYSRAGQFKTDKDSFIVDGSGNHLTGLLAQDGVLTGASGDLVVNSANASPSASTATVITLNLNSSSIAPSVDWAGTSSPVAASYNNVTSSTIYDSLGNSHVLSMYFIKGDSNAVLGAPNATSPINTTNQWYVAFQIDNQDVPAVALGATNAGGGLNYINFGTDGSFTNMNGVSGATSAAINYTITPPNGAAPLAFTVDFSSCTQVGSPFGVSGLTDNGFSSGSLRGLSIDASGVISGRYSNGKTTVMGQIQLASFADQQGLASQGNNTWVQTASSSQATVGLPGSGGLGAILSGSVEESNVDLTNQLVGLILAQRNFQANAQAIKTGDSIQQTLINLR